MGYSNLVTATQPNKGGGYKNILFFSPIGDITTWQRPTAAGLVVGDTKAIAAAHTWGSGKSVYRWDARNGSVNHTSESGGEEGAKGLVHVVRIDLLGDSAATLEQVEQMLNDNLVLFIKDASCLTADSYIQIGDDCNPAVATLVNFDGSTNSVETITNQKKHVLELRSKAKFFYNAAVDVTP